MSIYRKCLPTGVASNEKELLDQLSINFSFDAHLYTHQIGQVFSALSVVESTIIDALWMCENIEVDGKIRTISNTENLYSRKVSLQDKTFGNLIKVLKINNISEEGLNYFQFLKGKRDRFIHRFFEDHAFPGEIREYHFINHIRDLRYFEILFARAPHKIWKIIGREKYHHVVDMGPAGLLIMNDLGTDLR